MKTIEESVVDAIDNEMYTAKGTGDDRYFAAVAGAWANADIYADQDGLDVAAFRAWFGQHGWSFEGEAR